MDASQSGAAAAAAAVKTQSGSYGSVGSSEPLQPSALGVQRGLKDSVVNDMCRAVVKHMVGDVYVSASGSYGQRKVLNHLYEPVFASVQAHFRRLPARYALSVNPDDVPLHMRLLAQNQRDPTAIAVNAQLKKDDNGEYVASVLMEEDTRPSATSTQDSGVKENVSLAEKLGVLQMVDKNEIKAEWKLDLNEVRLEKAVGSGRSGSTYSAWWRGTHVAAKVVDSSTNTQAVGEELLNEFHREVAVVSKLRHPNIVLFLGAAINPPHLKSGNVLIDSHGTAKISDFGLSCVLEIGSSSDLTAETGTYRWMAPEVIRHEPYSSKADVYSFGIVLWELLARDQPFRGLTPIQGEQHSQLAATVYHSSNLPHYCRDMRRSRSITATGPFTRISPKRTVSSSWRRWHWMSHRVQFGCREQTHVQLGLLVAFNTIFIIAMVVRRPYLLRVFYVIGLLTSYLRIVMLLLTLVLVSSELVPQRIRDLISQIIICVNSLVLLCLFARVGYAAAKAMTKWLQNRKEAQAGANESDDSADLLPVEILENGGQRHVSLQRQPQSPPADGTPPSAQAYHQTTDRFAAGHWESRDATIGTFAMAGRFPSPVPPYPPLVMADSERDRLEFLAHRLIHKALKTTTSIDRMAPKWTPGAGSSFAKVTNSPCTNEQSPVPSTNHQRRQQQFGLGRKALATGILTREDNNERVGYHLMHSVSVPGYGPLDDRKIVRGQISSCILYTESPDSPAGVDVFMKARFDPNGNVSESVATQSAALALMYAAKISVCAQNKKLSWLLRSSPDSPVHRPSRSMSMTRQRSCPICAKSFSMFSGSVECEMCSTAICSGCSAKKKLGFARTGSKRVVLRPVAFCTSCLTHARRLNVFDAARQEVLAGFGVDETSASTCSTSMAKEPRPDSIGNVHNCRRRDLQGTKKALAISKSLPPEITRHRSKQIEDVNEVDDFGEITIHESSLVKVVDPRDQRSCSYPTPNPAAPGRESAQEEFMARIIAMRNAAEDAYRTTRKTAQAQFEQLSKAHNGFSHGQDSFSTHEVTISFYEVRAGKQVFAIQLQERALRQEELARNWSSITSTSSQQFLLDEDDENNSMTGSTSRVCIAAMRSYSQFRKLWRDLIRATKTPSTASLSRSNSAVPTHTEYSSTRLLAKSFQSLTVSDGEASSSCRCRNWNCTFRSLHYFLKSYPFPSKFLMKRNTPAVLENRRQGLELFITTVRGLFDTFPRPFLQSVDAFGNCQVLMALNAFFGINEKHQVNSIPHATLKLPSPSKYAESGRYSRSGSVVSESTTCFSNSSQSVASSRSTWDTDKDCGGKVHIISADEGPLCKSGVEYYLRDDDSNSNNLETSGSDFKLQELDEFPAFGATSKGKFDKKHATTADPTSAKCMTSPHPTSRSPKPPTKLQPMARRSRYYRGINIRRHTDFLARNPTMPYRSGSATSTPQTLLPGLPKVKLPNADVSSIRSFLEEFRDHLLLDSQALGNSATPINWNEDRQWELALYVASQIGHAYAVESILYRGTNPNAVMEDGLSSLHELAVVVTGTGSLPMCKLLLNYGASIHHKTTRGLDVVALAKSHGHENIARFCLVYSSNQKVAQRESSKVTQTAAGASTSEYDDEVRIVSEDGYAYALSKVLNVGAGAAHTIPRGDDECGVGGDFYEKTSLSAQMIERIKMEAGRRNWKLIHVLPLAEEDRRRIVKKFISKNRDISYQDHSGSLRKAGLQLFEIQQNAIVGVPMSATADSVAQLLESVLRSMEIGYTPDQVSTDDAMEFLSEFDGEDNISADTASAVSSRKSSVVVGDPGRKHSLHQDDGRTKIELARAAAEAAVRETSDSLRVHDSQDDDTSNPGLNEMKRVKSVHETKEVFVNMVRADGGRSASSTAEGAVAAPSMDSYSPGKGSAASALLEAAQYRLKRFSTETRVGRSGTNKLDSRPDYLIGGRAVAPLGELLGRTLCLLYVSRHGLLLNELRFILNAVVSEVRGINRIQEENRDDEATSFGHRASKRLTAFSENEWQALLRALRTLSVLFVQEVVVLPMCNDILRDVIWWRYMAVNAPSNKLPWHLKRCYQWDALRQVLVNLPMFQLLYTASYKAELFGYWKVLTDGPLLNYGAATSASDPPVYVMPFDVSRNTERALMIGIAVPVLPPKPSQLSPNRTESYLEKANGPSVNSNSNNSPGVTPTITQTGSSSSLLPLGSSRGHSRDEMDEETRRRDGGEGVAVKTMTLTPSQSLAQSGLFDARFWDVKKSMFDPTTRRPRGAMTTSQLASVKNASVLMTSISTSLANQTLDVISPENLFRKKSAYTAVKAVLTSSVRRLPSALTSSASLPALSEKRQFAQNANATTANRNEPTGQIDPSILESPSADRSVAALSPIPLVVGAGSIYGKSSLPSKELKLESVSSTKDLLTAATSFGLPAHFQDYPQSEWDLKQSYNHRVVLKLQALYDTVKTEVMQKQKYLRDVKRKTRETSRRYELAMRECDMAKHAAEEMSSRLAKLEHANKKELRLLSMKLKDLQDEKKVLHTKKTHLQNEELPILRKTVGKSKQLLSAVVDKLERAREKVAHDQASSVKLYQRRLEMIESVRTASGKDSSSTMEEEARRQARQTFSATTRSLATKVALQQCESMCEKIQKATGFSKMDLILQKFTRREELNASFEEQAKLYEARLKQIKLNQVELEEQLHSLELSQATTSTEDPRILEQNLRAAEVELARTEYTQASLVTSSKEVIAGAARIIVPDSSSRGRRRTVRGGDEKTTTRSSRYRRPPQLSSVAEKSKDKEKDKDRVGFDRGAVPPLAAAIGAVMAAMATQPNTPELEEGEQEPREEAEVLSRETIKASSRNKLAQRKRVNSVGPVEHHDGIDDGNGIFQLMENGNVVKESWLEKWFGKMDILDRDVIGLLDKRVTRCLEDFRRQSSVFYDRLETTGKDPHEKMVVFGAPGAASLILAKVTRTCFGPKNCSCKEDAAPWEDFCLKSGDPHVQKLLLPDVAGPAVTAQVNDVGIMDIKRQMGFEELSREEKREDTAALAHDAAELARRRISRRQNSAVAGGQSAPISARTIDLNGYFGSNYAAIESRWLDALFAPGNTFQKLDLYGMSSSSTESSGTPEPMGVDWQAGEAWDLQQVETLKCPRAVSSVPSLHAYEILSGAVVSKMRKMTLAVGITCGGQAQPNFSSCFLQMRKIQELTLEFHVAIEEQSNAFEGFGALHESWKRPGWD
ncbi:Ankyrin repeat-containing domain [Phytophthora cactorum]|nr:Ankyrin repeat-containing domain [Phytophthora cactorum]